MYLEHISKLLVIDLLILNFLLNKCVSIPCLIRVGRGEKIRIIAILFIKSRLYPVVEDRVKTSRAS